MEVRGWQGKNFQGEDRKAVTPLRSMLPRRAGGLCKIARTEQALKKNDVEL